MNDVLDEAGVSPVIGVILMVAITVVLAAVIFVIVSEIGGTEDPELKIQFLRDDDAGTLMVVRGDTIDLSLVEVQLGVDGYVTFNDRADSSSVPLPAGEFTRVTMTAGTIVRAGDYLSFCAPSAGQGVSLVIRDTSPRFVLYQNSFSYLRACT